MTAKYWMSSTPSTCDTCDTPITDKFYDAKTIVGPWANMCPSCFGFGPGIGKLGTGFGQEYTKKEIDGKVKFYKTGG